MRVERVVKPAESSFDDGDALEVDSIVRGRASQVYAYTQDFEAGDPVAAIISSWNSSETALELFSMDENQVIAQWGKRRLHLELDAIAADDCSERLESQRENASDVVTGSRGSHETTPATPPPDEPVCEP